MLFQHVFIHKKNLKCESKNLYVCNQINRELSMLNK
jgi:hypothetical protein